MGIQAVVDIVSNQIGVNIEDKIQEFITDKLVEGLFSLGSETEKSVFMLLNENENNRKRLPVAKNKLLLVDVERSYESMDDMDKNITKLFGDLKKALQLYDKYRYTQFACGTLTDYKTKKTLSSYCNDWEDLTFYD